MEVGAGLNEEIAGERGPWRASRAAQPNIFLASFLIVPSAELWFTYIKGVGRYEIRNNNSPWTALGIVRVSKQTHETVPVGFGPAQKFLLTDSLFPDLYCC